MTARKKKKEPKKTKRERAFQQELIALFLIGLALVLLFQLGVVGQWIATLGLIGVGRLYYLVPFGILVIAYVLFTGEAFDEKWKERRLGLLFLGLAGAVGMHFIYMGSLLNAGLEQSAIVGTWHDLVTNEGASQRTGKYGAGLVGGLLYSLFALLFDRAGVFLWMLVFVMIGIFLLADRSPKELTEKGRRFIGARWETWKKDRKKKEVDVHVPKETERHEKKEPIEERVVEVNHHRSEKKRRTKSTDDDEEEVEGDDSFALDASEDDDTSYQLPPIDLLERLPTNDQQEEVDRIQHNVKVLEETFQSFNVDAHVSEVHLGPAVTKYEILPATGVKVSRIVNLADDLALALAARDIRMEAPIPGKSAIGIEVPNQSVAAVGLKEVLSEEEGETAHKKLYVGLGRDVSGETIGAELNKMPHLLVAGSTGSGKSVCINGMIMSILLRAKPHEVRMMMIDPKMVELNVYNGIPHLLAPVVTDPRKAAQALQKIVSEMERRYELFSYTGTRNIEGYNKQLMTWNETHEETLQKMPYIVVIVDELADLMMVASSDVESAIMRLAQMARAAGIHLIIATQRPSVDVITGVIKANIPSRIAFAVSSAVDSRTILDSGGAEKLLGRGDMLYLPAGLSKPVRVQGAFVSDEEVERVVHYVIEQQKAQYEESMIPDEVEEPLLEDVDELFEEAVEIVIDQGQASISMLQRRLKIGYARAARIVDQMEELNIVGPPEGSKPRKLFIQSMEEIKSS